MTPEEFARMAELEAQGGEITPEYTDLFNKLAAHKLNLLFPHTGGAAQVPVSPPPTTNRTRRVRRTRKTKLGK